MIPFDQYHSCSDCTFTLIVACVSPIMREYLHKVNYGSGSDAGRQVRISCPEPPRMAHSERKCKLVRRVRGLFPSDSAPHSSRCGAWLDSPFIVTHVTIKVDVQQEHEP